MKVGELVKGTVEEIVFGGYGILRADGKIVFVDRVLPGEQVEVLITKVKKKYCFGKLNKVVKASKHRIKPKCRYFDECGGCDFQHVVYKEQLRLKVNAAIAVLRKIGKVTVNDYQVYPSDEVWGYRIRTRFHLEKIGSKVKVGFFKKGTRDLVPVSECPIADEQINLALKKIERRLLLESISCNFVDVLAWKGQLSVYPPIGDLSYQELEIDVGEFRYIVNPRVFFQVNKFLLNTLIKLVVGKIKGDNALDLYAGVGFFSLPLARRFKEVVAVEGDKTAYWYLKKNSKLFPNLTAIHKDVDSYLTTITSPYEVVVVDPPRTGLNKTARKHLCEIVARSLIYVSCNPSTLARDLFELSSVFDIESVTFVDLFPHTYHLESIVVLVPRFYSKL